MVFNGLGLSRSMMGSILIFLVISTFARGVGTAVGFLFLFTAFIGTIFVTVSLLGKLFGGAPLMRSFFGWAITAVCLDAVLFYVGFGPVLVVLGVIVPSVFYIAFGLKYWLAKRVRIDDHLI